MIFPEKLDPVNFFINFLSYQAGTMFCDSGRIIRVDIPAKRKPPKHYKCEFCDAGWQSETEVYLHKRSHYKEVKSCLKNNDPVCLICVKVFESKESLVEHIKIDHLLSSPRAQRVEREIFVCDTCKAIFFNKNILTLHLRLVHKLPSNDKFFKCPVESCKKKIQSLFWGHDKLHNIRSVSCCPICLFKCVDRSDLRKHLKTHQLLLRCNTCNPFLDLQMTVYLKHLERHNKVLKSNEPFEYAHYFVPRDGNFRLTVTTVLLHKGLKMQNMLNVCVLCRHICITKKQMKQHILNHKCSTIKKKAITQNVCCGIQFPNQILYKQHTLTQHKVKRETEVKHETEVKQEMEVKHETEVEQETEVEPETETLTVIICEDENIISNNENIISDNQNTLCKEESIVCEEENIICNDENIICKQENMICEHENIICKEESIVCEEENIISNNENTIFNDENIICKEESIVCEEGNIICNNENIISNNESILSEVKEEMLTEENSDLEVSVKTEMITIDEESLVTSDVFME